MRSFINLKTVGAGAAAALVMGLASATPAAAQSYGDPLIDAAVRAVLGVSTQDNRYYGQQGTYRGPDCQYYRDGRFWRNHGEWRSYQNRRDRDYRYDRRW